MQNHAQDFRREIEQYTDDIPYWDPAPGDSIVGTLIGVDMRTTKFSSDVPVLTIRADDGTLTEVWATHTVLRGELKKLKPKVGRPLALKRLADAEPPLKYRRYKVFLDAADQPAFSWDAVSDDGSDTPAGDTVATQVVDFYKKVSQQPPSNPLEPEADGMPF
jgi:hypothetical protein